jgi:NADH dehydrogenase FAD-containing subunit
MGATTEIVVINPTDYFLYLLLMPLMPLMPQVAGGMVEPAHSRVSLPSRLRKSRLVLGTVTRVDPSPAAKTVSWAGPEGAAGQVRYDRLILAAGKGPFFRREGSTTATCVLPVPDYPVHARHQPTPDRDRGTCSRTSAISGSPRRT